MNQDNVSKFVKEIRKKNNLTQKDLANKYNVTYQAVSKWENGKNIPDMYLLKQMSVDFNVKIDDILDGKIVKKNYFNKRSIVIIGIIVILSLIILIWNNNSDFNFKTISSNCNNFDISGSIAYNDKKSSIYITNIKYCGDYLDIKYNYIECILYESNNNIERKISDFKYEGNDKINLEEFLKEITFSIDNYKQSCKEYSKNSLFLSINAINDNRDITSYKIPLLLDDSCNE